MQKTPHSKASSIVFTLLEEEGAGRFTGNLLVCPLVLGIGQEFTIDNRKASTD